MIFTLIESHDFLSLSFRLQIRNDFMKQLNPLHMIFLKKLNEPLKMIYIFSFLTYHEFLVLPVLT